MTLTMSVLHRKLQRFFTSLNDARNISQWNQVQSQDYIGIHIKTLADITVVALLNSV